MSNKDEIINKASSLIEGAKAKGISNYKVAKGTGISEKTIGNYVHGKTTPTYPNAVSLINYFEREGQMLKNAQNTDEALKNDKKETAPKVIDPEVWEVLQLQAQSLAKRDNQIDELISLLKDSKKDTAATA